MVTQADRREATIKAILEAARALLTAHGFDTTSIDDIAARAGIAKGAVYHHFASKEQIFARVFEQMTAELAASIPAAARAGVDLLDSVRRGILKYLTAIASDEFRQVLLIDGPAVLGWQRWREIDARYFGGSMQSPMAAVLKQRASARELEALGHLIAGAMTEAALACAASDHRLRTARDLTATLVKMLRQFFPDSE